MTYLCDDPGKGHETFAKTVIGVAGTGAILGSIGGIYAGYRIGEFINDQFEIVNSAARISTDMATGLSGLILGTPTGAAAALGMGYIALSTFTKLSDSIEEFNYKRRAKRFEKRFGKGSQEA